MPRPSNKNRIVIESPGTKWNRIMRNIKETNTGPDRPKVLCHGEGCGKDIRLFNWSIREGKYYYCRVCWAKMK